MGRPKKPENVRLGARLRDARLAAEYTHQTLAVAMRKGSVPGQHLPAITDVVRTIQAQEAGTQAPGPVYRDLWSRVLRIPQDDLFAMSAVLSGPGQTDEASGDAFTLVGDPTSDQEDAEMRRRAALQIIAAAAAGAMAPPGSLEVLLTDVRGRGPAVNLGDWAEMVHEYGLALVERPAGALIPEITADLVVIGNIMSGPLDEKQTTGMMRIRAGLTGLLAIEFGDVGDARSARKIWRTSIAAADASGDDQLRVWARGRAAQDGIWQGRPGQIIEDLIYQALAIGGDKPYPGMARVFGARAYLAAHRDLPEAACVEIANLKRLCDRIPNLDGDQTPLAYRSTHMFFADGLTKSLGNDQAAERAISGALDLYPPHARAALSNLKLMQSLVMMGGQEYSDGLEHAVLALKAPGAPQSSARDYLVGRILNEIPPELTSGDSAAELRELTSGSVA